MEHDINKTNIDIALQDVASSECEEQKNQEVERKIDSTENKLQTDKRKRCSGAARRRYKKQRRLMEASQLQNAPPKITSIVGPKKVGPSETTSATDFKEIIPPEATSATDLKEVNPVEVTSATDLKEVSPLKATSAIDVKEVSPPEITSAIDLEKVSSPEATLATDLEEVDPPEATSAIDAQEISPPEIISATDLEEVDPPEATLATDPEEVSSLKAISAIGAKEVNAPISELRHNWSVHEVPSLSEGYSNKKLEIQYIDQSSYVKQFRVVNNTIKMAFILEGFPEKKLDDNDILFLKKNITRHILDLDKSIKAPTFTGMWKNDGAVIVHCVDEYSKYWLKYISHELNINGVSVRLLPAEDLYKPHRVMVHVTYSEISIKDVLKLFDKQNEGLAAEEWFVIKSSERRDAFRIRFIAFISNSSLKALKKLKFKPYCGVVRATVQLLKENDNTFIN